MSVVTFTAEADVIDVLEVVPLRAVGEFPTSVNEKLQLGADLFIITLFIRI